MNHWMMWMGRPAFDVVKVAPDSNEVKAPVEMKVEVVKVIAPRRKILNKTLLSVIPSALIKQADPSVDSAVREAKAALCKSVMRQLAVFSHGPPAQD